eukprot:40845-Chlamydomonas_euryale.AAC.11
MGAARRQSCTGATRACTAASRDRTMLPAPTPPRARGRRGACRRYAAVTGPWLAVGYAIRRGEVWRADDFKHNRERERPRGAEQRNGVPASPPPAPRIHPARQAPPTGGTTSWHGQQTDLAPCAVAQRLSREPTVAVHWAHAPSAPAVHPHVPKPSKKSST